MDRSAPRILYVAVADGRGHLMRAHLLREVLGRAGLGVDIVTTTEDGRRFLEGLGTPSRVLSDRFRIEFNDRHDMSRRRTDLRVLRYVVDPSWGLRELRKLEAWADGYAMVVNDSLHPALMLAPLLSRRMRVVQVFGENLWEATEHNFDGRLPKWLSARYARALRAVRDRSFARVIHTLGKASLDSPREARLPPIVAAPRRTAEEVRARLGVAPGERLAAVYLNPHFRDPSIAEAIERGLRSQGFRLHAVGEGYVGRPGWLAQDAQLGEAVAAADLFVSGAGMGALAQARTFGTPMLVLLGDQPEQARNVEALHAPGRLGVVRLREASGDLEAALRASVATLAPRGVLDGTAAVLRTHALWTDTFWQLTRAARMEAAHDPSHDRARPGDQQPSRWGQGRLARHRRARAAA